jgi:hypothetical protein
LFITASPSEQTTVLRLAGNKEGHPYQRAVTSRWRFLNMSEAPGYWADETIQASLNACSDGPSSADISISTQKRRKRYQMDYGPEK